MKKPKRQKTVTASVVFRGNEAASLAFALDIAAAVLDRMADRMPDVAPTLKSAARRAEGLRRALASAALKQRAARKKKH